MNEWLANIYGTAGAEDIEKTAQAEMLNKLAQEENIDLSQFSPEELQMLANEMMASQGLQAAQNGMAPPGMQPQQPQMQQPQMGGGIAPAGGLPPRPQQAQPQQGQFGQQAQPQAQSFQQASQPGMDPTAMQKEAAAKFDEADLLGRVMAHAYTQELEKIASAKTAGARMNAVKGAVGKATAHVKANKGAYGAGAGGAAAGFAAGRMSKKASAFEKLAEEHAGNILSAVGVDPQTGNSFQQEGQNQPQAPQQAQMNAQPQGNQFAQQGFAQQAPQQQPDFQQALDSRALEILEANGYDVEAILNTLAQQNPGVQQ